MHAGKVQRMKDRKFFQFFSAGVTVLGLTLCVPAAMMAQNTDRPESSQMTTPQTDSQGGTQSTMGMHHHGPPSPERQLKHLTKTLSLTADQQKQMLPILQDRQTQMEAMRNNTSLDPQQRRGQMRTLMQDTNQKLEAVMTGSQKQQFEQQMQARRQHMQNGHMGQNSGSAPPDAGTPPPPPPPQM